jgi:hypothetical protein
MTSIIKVDEIQNSAGTTTLAKVDNGVLTGALSPATGFRNRIINGDMRIDQRNAGAAVTASQAFVVDRFEMGNSTAGTYSAQRVAEAPAGFNNSVKVTITSADTVLSSGALQIRQHIEGFNVADFGWGTTDAQPVTLSFWVRSSLTGTFGGVLRNNDVNRSYPYTYTISSANTWEHKTVVVPGDTSGTWVTDNGLGIRLTFGLGVSAGASGTAGAWSSSSFASATGAVSLVGTNGATWQITGVQLEKGTVATPFEFRSIGQEETLCWRYCVFIQNFYLRQYQPAATAAVGTVWFPAHMRADPTATLSSLAYTNASGGITLALRKHSAAVQYNVTAAGNGVVTGNYLLSAEL